MKYFSRMRIGALLLLLSVSLFGCGTSKYICRVITDSDDLIAADSALTDPFISEDERNRLIEEAVAAHLKESPQSFTYEIISENLVFYEGKDTLIDWLNVTDAEGFAYVIGMIIQQR